MAGIISFSRKKVKIVGLFKIVSYIGLVSVTTTLIKIGLYNNSVQKTASNIYVQNTTTDDQAKRVQLTTTTPNHDLANLRNFTFLKVSPKCDDSVFLVLVVPSHPVNRERREVLRSVYNRRIFNQTCRVVFLYGQQDDPTLTSIMDDEQEVHHDMIQGNFKDSYKSVAYNHLQGLKWVTNYCQQAKYVVKTDDDVFVNLYKLVWDLTHKMFGQNVIYCSYTFGGPVSRDKNDKYYVSEDQFAEKDFPLYCSGWLVVYGQSAAKEVVAQASVSKFLWMSDAFITGVIVKDLEARNSSVHVISMKDDFTFNDDKLKTWLQKGTAMPGYYTATGVNGWRFLRAIHQKIERLSPQRTFSS